LEKIKIHQKIKIKTNKQKTTLLQDSFGLAIFEGCEKGQTLLKKNI